MQVTKISIANVYIECHTIELNNFHRFLNCIRGSESVLIESGNLFEKSISTYFAKIYKKAKCEIRKKEIYKAGIKN